MAQRYDRIPQIEISTLSAQFSPRELVDVLNQRIQLMNEVLAEISTAEAETRGDDGRTPSFRANVDMGRNRVTNAQRSRDPFDAVVREELMEIGLLGNPDGIAFSVPVNFGSGVSSSGPTSGGTGELTTSEQVTDAITQVTGVVPVARAGQLVDDGDYGTQGTTDGTLLMIVGRDGRAQFVRGDNGRAVFEIDHVAEILGEILDQLKLMNERFGNGMDTEGP